MGTYMRYYPLRNTIIAAALFVSSWASADLLAAAGTTPTLGIRDKTPDARAFINARIVISPEVTLESATLLIKDGYIIDAGTDVAVPDGYSIIDLKGKSVYPGFIEAFGNYGIAYTQKATSGKGRGPQYETERLGGNTWNEAVHAEFDWGDYFKPEKKQAEELLKNGFAVVQSARPDGVFRGRTFVALLGEGLPNDLMIVPRGSQVISLSKGTSTQDYPSSVMGTIAMIRQMMYDIDWYNKAHDAYRLDPKQKMPEFNAAIEALADVKNETVLFDPGASTISLAQARHIAEEFNLHPVYVASGKEYSHIANMANFAAPLIVPVAYPDPPEITTAEDELDVTLGQLRHWETAPSNPAYLERAGIDFALTTYQLKKKDNFLKNIRDAIDRGLSEKKALEALTVVPARICGISDRAGTLEPGKLANFIICDGDIFAEDATIYSVWVAGRKNELTPLPIVEFPGQYLLTVDARSFTLTLEGKPARLTGDVSSGDWSEKLQNVSIDRNFISFSCRLDSLEHAKPVLFSGRKSEHIVTGRCQSADGAFTDWSAQWQSTIPQKSDSTEDHKKENDSLFAHITFPNIAYGPAEPARQQDVLIRNATVWTAEDSGILEQTDILVQNGTFAAIGKNLTAPADAVIIDAAGKQVTPGIIDAHSHLAIFGDVNEGTHAITPEVRIGDVIDPEDINIYRQLAGGVTSCLTLHGSANPIGGQCQVIKLRWGADADGMKYANAGEIIKFALGENVVQANWGERFTTRYPQSRMGVEAIIRDEFQAAREYERDWQVYNALGAQAKKKTIPPRKDLGLDAIVNVLHSRSLIHCHTYMQAETLMLMRLAEDFGFTIACFIHVLEGYKVADEMARHGASGTTFSDWWAYKFEVYDAIPYNACLMADRGVLTSLNSDDADLARRLNQEAAKAIHYGGMAPEEAIKLVTINSAKQLGLDASIGSIAVGKDADFVIWSDNPLSMYSRAEQTWIDGRKYFDLNDDDRLRRNIARERNDLIQKVLNAAKTGGGKKESPNDSFGME